MNNLTGAYKSILVAFTVSIGLAACAANQQPVISTTTVKTVANETIKLLPTNIQNNITKVQNATKTVCRFVPTAQTVVALVDNSTTTVTISKLASTICNIVGNRHKRVATIHRFGATSGQVVITSYNGIVIQGYFN